MGMFVMLHDSRNMTVTVGNNKEEPLTTFAR